MDYLEGSVVRESEVLALPMWTLAVVVLAFSLAIALPLHTAAHRRVRSLISPTRRMSSVILSRLRAPTLWVAFFAIAATLLRFLSADNPGTAGASTAAAVALTAAAGWTVVVVIGALMQSCGRRYRGGHAFVDGLAKQHREAFRGLYFAAIVAAAALTLAVCASGAGLDPGVPLALVAASLLVLGLAIWRGRKPFGNLLALVGAEGRKRVRLEAAVSLDGDIGWIEDIAPTYAIVRMWDWRRVPVAHVDLIRYRGSATEVAAAPESVIDWQVRRSVPIDRVREKLRELARETPLWDGGTATLDVAETNAETQTLRAVLTARNAEDAWQMRAGIREQMLVWLRTDGPAASPKLSAPSRTPFAHKTAARQRHQHEENVRASLAPST